MRAIVLAVILALGACTDASAPASENLAPRDWSTLPPELEGASLSAEGLGPIRIGGPVAEVLRLIPDRFDAGEVHEASPDCQEYGLISQPMWQVGLLVYDGVVHRISIQQTELRTDQGIGVGSTAAEVLAAYPDAERRSAEYVPEPGHELYVWSSREDHVGLKFEIGEDERVTAIHAGSDLGNNEGCATL